MRKILWALFITWYGLYLTLIGIVQNWSHKGIIIAKLGLWGNIIFIAIPPITFILYYLIYYRKRELFIGITKLSSGSGRVDAFQNIRERAEQKIFIVGIGMSNLSKYAKYSLSQKAKNVAIDFLMISPDYLEHNPNFTGLLEGFLGMKGFAKIARTAFDELKQLCIENNKIETHKRMRMRVYNTIPTASMVMIDPDSLHAECVVEFFLYKSGEKRPRFECKRFDNKNDLLNILKERYTLLWHDSKIIVE